jgi:transcriptional repressor NrdR
VSAVEAELQQRTYREIESREISDLVLQHLRSLSEVAYIRYASVYCDFENVESFVATLDRLRSAPPLTAADVPLTETETIEPSRV